MTMYVVIKDIVSGGYWNGTSWTLDSGILHAKKFYSRSEAKRIISKMRYGWYTTEIIYQVTGKNDE